MVKNLVPQYHILKMNLTIIFHIPKTCLSQNSSRKGNGYSLLEAWLYPGKRFDAIKIENGGHQPGNDLNLVVKDIEDL
ncbi:MAG TPA: hypothetical protein VK616_10290 [Flavitalea sp.]|nr:hypothetical protein [Flavitalea sp.]